jgi:lipooligosaccharide transport system permease protein
MRWVAVWRRNFLVWRKLVIASVLSNLADPLILLFGLGYGLGALLPSVEGMSYIAFFAAGTLCSATMFTASFESMFSGFSRMHGQKTWDAILYAPLTIDDIVAGEIVWAASKAWLSGATILAVAAVFGFAASPMVVLTLPVAFLVGLAFAACGLIMTVLARNWDFFSFYMTLIMTPMTMISGVFFPAEQLPRPVLAVAQALPLYHGVEDRPSIERFKVMERKLYWGIMTPGGVLTLIFGAWLWLGWFRGAGGWLHAKIALGALLAGYHLWCGRLLGDFAADRNTRSHLWLRWFNEFPVLVLIAAVLVVVFKPD